MHMSTQISMKSIGELKNFKFAIPNYQRGYRWTSQQVKELLDDIWEFSDKEKDTSLIYCIQPLVVCDKKKDTENLVTDIKKLDNWDDICKFVKKNIQTWEVIDGQQRLTTISIIIQMLCKKAPFTLSYDTLPNSEKKINSISKLQLSDANSDINLHFMNEAKNTVETWLKNKDGEAKERMEKTILERVKFIWYETDEDKPISVFTRLNVGRISLTSSELIKALFLNRENFQGISDEMIRARQTQIAQEWDAIENQLQDDEFWLFLRNLNKDHKDEWNKPTRIDFLLDSLSKEEIIKKMNSNNNKNFCLTYEDSIIGKDKYRTFRAYYECYKSTKQEFLNLWLFLKEIFDIWKEWYDNSELYHYVGYLLTENASSLDSLILKWLGQTRAEFIDDNKREIRYHLKKKKCLDLERDYCKDGKDSKRDCIPLLLLHNVETIVRQNKVLIENEQYQLGVFYKFPFHLYKIEHWDVEHIDSATENDLVDDDAQRNWILSAYQCLKDDDKGLVNDSLKAFFSEEKDHGNEHSISFGKLYSVLVEKLQLNSSNSPNWKNKVQNYVLLDSSTNRNYKNAIFPDKRSHIVGKEKGVHKIAYWNKEDAEIDIKEEKFKSAFVPVCTKNVFQKTYSTMLGNPTTWDETDSESYKSELESTLEEFINNEQQ